MNGAALRVQLVAPHGWGNPAGRVETPASPVLPLGGSWACTASRATASSVGTEGTAVAGGGDGVRAKVSGWLGWSPNVIVYNASHWEKVRDGATLKRLDQSRNDVLITVALDGGMGGGRTPQLRRHMVSTTFTLVTSESRNVLRSGVISWGGLGGHCATPGAMARGACCCSVQVDESAVVPSNGSSRADLPNLHDR